MAKHFGSNWHQTGKIILSFPFLGSSAREAACESSDVILDDQRKGKLWK